MRALTILLFIGLFGCASEIHRSVAIPSKWEAPTLYLRLPEEMSANDPRIDIVKEMCKEFTIRLYDAFDGQIYVRKFVICNPSLARETEPGMMTLFEPNQIFIRHSETWMDSPPLRPGYSWIVITDDIKRSAGTLIHEWLHSYIGLGDEYKRATDRENAQTTSCPIDPKQRLDDSACIMLTANHRELCRSSNHNPDTDQGKEPCYEFAARVLAESRLAFIKVPKHRIVGPFDAPTPIIEVRLR